MTKQWTTIWLYNANVVFRIVDHPPWIRPWLDWMGYVIVLQRKWCYVVWDGCSKLETGILCFAWEALFFVCIFPSRPMFRHAQDMIKLLEIQIFLAKVLVGYWGVSFIWGAVPPAQPTYWLFGVTVTRFGKVRSTLSTFAYLHAVHFLRQSGKKARHAWKVSFEPETGGDLLCLPLDTALHGEWRKPERKSIIDRFVCVAGITYVFSLHQDEPFTSHLPEALFNIARFLLHSISGGTPPNGVSKVYPVLFWCYEIGFEMGLKSNKQRLNHLMNLST